MGRVLIIFDPIRLGKLNGPGHLKYLSLSRCPTIPLTNWRNLASQT